MKNFARFISNKKAAIATAVISASASVAAMAADEPIDYTQMTDKIQFSGAQIALMAAGGAILAYVIATKGMSGIIKFVKGA